MCVCVCVGREGCVWSLGCDRTQREDRDEVELQRTLFSKRRGGGKKVICVEKRMIIRGLSTPMHKAERIHHIAFWRLLFVLLTMGKKWSNNDR